MARPRVKGDGKGKGKDKEHCGETPSRFLEIFRQVKCTSRMLIVVLTEASLDKLPLLDFRHRCQEQAGLAAIRGPEPRRSSQPNAVIRVWWQGSSWPSSLQRPKLELSTPYDSDFFLHRT